MTIKNICSCAHLPPIVRGKVLRHSPKSPISRLLAHYKLKNTRTAQPDSWVQHSTLKNVGQWVKTKRYTVCADATMTAVRRVSLPVCASAACFVTTTWSCCEPPTSAISASYSCRFPGEPAYIFSTKHRITIRSCFSFTWTWISLKRQCR